MLRKLFGLNEGVVPLNDGEIAAVRKIADWVASDVEAPVHLQQLAREIINTLNAAATPGPRRGREWGN